MEWGAGRAQRCWCICRDPVRESQTERQPQPGAPGPRQWRWSTPFSFLPLLTQGRHSCARDGPNGKMCFQDSQNNRKWYFILWKEATPTFCVSYMPLCIYLLQISGCLWFLWMPRMAIENLGQRKDYLESKTPSTHHLIEPQMPKVLLAGGKNYKEVNVCKSLAELAEQRRSK